MYRRILVLCVIALWAGMAVAEPVSSFTFSQTNYSVAPGAQVSVDVYWQQTVSGADTSVLDLSSDIGMFGQGVQVRWDDPVVPSHPATVVATGDIAYNGGPSGFNDTGSGHKTVASSYAQLSEVTDGSTFVYGSQVSTGVWRQLIGTFSFTAGPVLGEVTHLRAKRYVGPLGTEDYIVDGYGDAYDSASAQATATITVVPEPSTLTLALGCLAALTIFAARCWSERRKQVSLERLP